MWYAIKTRPSKEETARTNLLKAIEKSKSPAVVYEIKIPTININEIRNGKKKTVTKKFMPGYIFVKTEQWSDTHHNLIRMVPELINVVGFPNPKPLTNSEVDNIHLEEREFEMTSMPEPGDSIKVIAGPFENMTGVVESVNNETGSVVVKITVFDRATPVSFNISEIIQV